VLTGQPDDTGSTIFFTAENEDIQPSYEEVTRVIKCLKALRIRNRPNISRILKDEQSYGEESTILLN
jgi:hypothetical protein